jgi:hypothetical protein
MLSNMLALTEFAKMDPEERSRALRTLTSAPNGARVDAEIHELEVRYEMSSEKMREGVRRGEIDTADTARWLVLLRARGR